MSKILEAAKCSQMSNPKSGTGSGGDRCVEATCAMIDATYKYGPRAAAGADVESIMYGFVAEWNGPGKVVSALESGQRIVDFLKEYSVEVNAVNGIFSNVQNIVERGHIAYTGVSDYRQLRLVGGGNPYQWNPETQPGPAGHVLLIVGYDDGVVVHDPLRAIGGMPASYSITSFEAAGWETIGEVMGVSLAPPAEAIEYRIQPGNTLWALAEHYYGDGEMYHVLVEANPGINPRMLHIGQIITIPPKPGN